MKGVHQHLPKEVDQSFIVYQEKLPFPKYHYHPEYELAFIIEGRGTLLVGDYVDHFRENDLVFIGPYLPHEHRCDPQYFGPSGEFAGRAVVIQFTHDFLGETFLKVPENKNLNSFLSNSSRGCRIVGKDRHQIVDGMHRMVEGTLSDRLYILMEIFNTFSSLNEYSLLSSSGFDDPYRNEGSGSIGKSIEYIIQNFQKDIKIKDLLDLTQMSSSRFSNEFRKVTRMSFKSYLNQVKISYACRLLAQGEMNVSEAAFQAGFENLSNFNRQFKRINKITPSQYARINKTGENLIHTESLSK